MFMQHFFGNKPAEKMDLYCDWIESICLVNNVSNSWAECQDMESLHHLTG